MLKNPVLKYNFHAEFMDDEKVLLASEKENTVLCGKLFVRVLKEITQNPGSMDELIARLSGTLSMMDVFLAVQVLEDKGYLTEASPGISRDVCAYWNGLGMNIHKLEEILGNKTLSLEFIGLEVVKPFREAFEAIGIKVVSEGNVLCNGGGDLQETGVLRVVVTDNYFRSELEHINKECLEKNQPWLLVKPVGVELWVGPLFIPGKTGCYGCLKQRLDINFPMEMFYKSQKGSDQCLPKPVSGTLLSFQMAANMTGLEIVKWFYYGGNESVEGKIMSFDTSTGRTDSHILVKRPQCLWCGEHRGTEPLPIVLEKRSDYCLSSRGGYRELSPEETVEKYCHHVSPITGIVQRLEPYHRMKNSPVFNYSSGRNIAFRTKSLFWINQHLRSGSGGKGKTWAQAKTGALCEAIERYSLTYQGDEEFHITKSLNELGGDGIHPNLCMNYSEKQYETREESNRDGSKFYALVPAPFDPDLKMDWTPVFSLNHKKFKYLPSCFCYAQYPVEDEANPFAFPDSNGCAAGNSVEEAILQGFLELVERDSVALWWYNRLKYPGVDLQSFGRMNGSGESQADDPYIPMLMDYYRSIHRSLTVLDLTADLGIPTFGAISHRLDRSDEKKHNILFGFGAHVDAKIALERALVELNQLLPIAHGQDTHPEEGKYLTQDNVFVHWLENATMENQPYLTARQDIPLKNASDYPRLCNPNIYDSVQHCIERAAAAGLETFVLNLTRKDIGLPVVKVIVPGMRHFWKRTAPGRLYDIPVQIGLLAKPHTEDCLNPIGLFI